MEELNKRIEVVENRISLVEKDTAQALERSDTAKVMAFSAIEFARIIGDQLSTSAATTARYINEISISMAGIRSEIRKSEIQNFVIMFMVGIVIVGALLAWATR